MVHAILQLHFVLYDKYRIAQIFEQQHGFLRCAFPIREICGCLIFKYHDQHYQIAGYPQADPLLHHFQATAGADGRISPEELQKCWCFETAASHKHIVLNNLVNFRLISGMPPIYRVGMSKQLHCRTFTGVR